MTASREAPEVMSFLETTGVEHSHEDGTSKNRSIIDLSLSTATRSLSLDFASLSVRNVPLQLIKSHTTSEINRSVKSSQKHALSERELALAINSRCRGESKNSGRNKTS